MSSYSVLGPAGSNGHLVFSRVRNEWDNRLFLESNSGVIENVEKGGTDLGIVPIENGIGGLVSDVVKYWVNKLTKNETRREGVFIIDEIDQKITHDLLVSPEVNDAKEIKTVISHPQALQQCSILLDKLGIVERQASQSTAAAAEFVSMEIKTGRLSIAAIASPFASSIYGLKTLVSGIENYSDNMTRFHIISRYPASNSCSNKNIIMFTLPHVHGSLAKVLNILNSIRSNLYSIHSIPLVRLGKYVFYIEFESEADSNTIKFEMEEIRKMSLNFLHLGSF